jgi:hypothetical protein
VCVCVLIYLGLIFVLLVNNEGGRVIISVFSLFFYFVENLDSFWFCLGLGLEWKI